MKKLIFIVLYIAAYTYVMCNTGAVAVEVLDYYNEVLEFDDEGNLLMTTHDKKATSKITYRTLGWIIKRYDAPLDAPGQKYAVIKMRYADIQYREDPEDRAYIYCYYYGDKQEIYSAVDGANKKWREILYNYGDYVYIDEVMTVCSNGVPLGTLESSSSNCIKSTGEVYYDYDGIANARNWASKQSLLTHFNKKVKYPSMVIAPGFSIEEAKCDSIYDTNQAVAIGTIGSKKENEEIYDVTEGIPVTEQLFVKTVADSASYNIRFDRYMGSALFPVKIITTYHFKWTDYYGVNRTEEVKAVRYYLVERDFAYWRVGSLSYKYLSGVKVNNYALLNGKYQVSGLDAPNITLEQSSGYENHISISDYVKTVKIDGGTVKGKNGLRPSIPDEDYSRVAEESVGVYEIKNDYLKIGSQVVLSKAKSNTTGSNPVTYAIEDTTIYKTDLSIPSDRLNGEDYKSTGKAYYTGYKNGKVYSVDIQAIEPVTIHTPVVCEGGMYTNNSFNQQVKPNPDMNNVVIGKSFLISTGTTGSHKDIKGYGYRNYSKYTRSSQIRFPIPMYYRGKVYAANTWIDIEGSASFVVPVGVNEGSYKYELRNIAINTPDIEDYTDITKIKYNNDVRSYVAGYEGKFDVSGRIFGFRTKLSGNNQWYSVGNRDENGNTNNSQNVMLMEVKDNLVEYEVTTVGDYADNNDGINIYLDFFYIKDDKMIPVSVYCKVGNMCTLIKEVIKPDYAGMRYIGNEELIKVSSKEQANRGAQLWSGEIDLTGKIIAIPKGDYGEQVEYNTIKSKAFRGGSLLINADIYAVDSGVEKLSYINVDNWKKGYCNMWNKEGFDYKEIYKDGDCIISGVAGYQREDYIVIGTH